MTCARQHKTAAQDHRKAPGHSTRSIHSLAVFENPLRLAAHAHCRHQPCLKRSRTVAISEASERTAKSSITCARQYKTAAQAHRKAPCRHPGTIRLFHARTNSPGRKRASCNRRSAHSLRPRAHRRHHGRHPPLLPTDAGAITATPARQRECPRGGQRGARAARRQPSCGGRRCRRRRRRRRPHGPGSRRSRVPE